MSQPIRTTYHAQEKLFVALDVDTERRALELVKTLSVCTQSFKIGLQLFTAAGPDIVRKIVDLGARVFLDLKFHDIPQTVARSSAEAARLGVYMFNVHAAGGHEMMHRAFEAAAEAATNNGSKRPLLLGVTMLTSVDSSLLRELGIVRTMEEQVAHLAQASADAGLDGVVASPREIQVIRARISNPDFVVVTPGVRPKGLSNNDQRRVMTPAEATKAGATYLVVGRPITDAPDPLAATRQILAEIESAQL